MEIILGLAIGLIVGGVAVWFIAKFKHKSEKGISQKELDEKYIIRDYFVQIENETKVLKEETKKKDEVILSLNKNLSSAEQLTKNLEQLSNSRKTENQGLLDSINTKYVERERLTEANSELAMLKQQISGRDAEILNLNKELVSKKQIIDNLNDKFITYKKEIEDLQNKMKIEFENIANKILEDRSEKFLETSKSNISAILNPIKDNISDFKTRIENLYGKEAEERINLKVEIKNLLDLNKQLSTDANNLATALKGENKTQGNWGEVQLELILQRAGLMKNTHYRVQEIFDAGDDKRLQPDCIVNLPENKHLVIDSKVSLVAFERYFNANNEDDKVKNLRLHLESIIGHVKELSRKNYQNLHQINQPDYILMFVAYESALSLAMKEDSSIFEQALEKNIVLVTGSTLLATLRTVSYIWKQENQKKHVLEVAKEGGALYDKFVSFVEDLKKIGESIEQARVSHDAAMNKLTLSVKKGDTLIGRAEKIRKLGVSATKMLPQDLIDKAELNNE
jgi:DNA recombination protein RmuC